jgi:hypothetical protein
MNGETKAATVAEVRRACRQFAMLYFHFCKILVETMGEERALPLVQKALFELSLERSGGARERARDQGLAATLENFALVNDLPSVAWEEWEPSGGEVRCPYAQQWLGYYREYPWFKKFASLYCDVIDTTNIENFSRTTSHRLMKNLLWGDPDCEREYFESEQVKEGNLSYGKREEGGQG